MVTKNEKTFPLKDVRISRVVLTSGLLTFIYCIELCIGIRTIYYTFKIWSDQSTALKHVNLITCLGCLFTAVVSTFTVNVLSAIWEQKQLEEKGKQKSYIRFVFHIIIGSMIWRYFSLGCIDSKECQKKSALLLTMSKFFFTQTFTIPLVIVHASVLENFDELIFDICTVLCVSVNLILTCIMFDWCYSEVEELKKWKFETVELVPLIFQWDPKVIAERESKISDNSVSKEVSKQEKKKECDEKKFEERIIKFLVLLQSFGFSFGRLLALGILLRFAGIYAVSIMFLQLLISVIYLKFQVPILVSESLPKWRQLSRLAFMSYILIFEWHLNRDPKTAYDFSSSMKHSITYYCIATVESVFYLVTWAVTTSFSAKSELGDETRQENRFCRVILIIGSLALVFSLTIHIVLLFWRSRRISVFLYSVRRRYETAKLRLSKYGCVNVKNPKTEKARKLTPSDISDPIPIQDNDDETNKERIVLPKQNSYRDLKEPVDDEIEIYFRKCKSKEDITDQENDHDNVNDQNPMPAEDSEFSQASVVIKTIDHLLHSEMENFKSTATESLDKPMTPVRATLDDNKNTKNEEEPTKNPKKLKKMLSFENINEQWEKMSSSSRKFAVSMKEQIQKRNKQIQSFRGSSNTSKDETDPPADSIPPSPATENTTDSGIQTPEENVEISEGYFIGDSRCHRDEPLSTVVEKRLRFSEGTSASENVDREADEEADNNHKEGDQPCSCFICKALGEGRLRRRSSSVPPADRKSRQEEDGSGSNQTLTRYMSSPNITQIRCESRKFDHDLKEKNKLPPPKEKNKLPLPAIYTSTVLNLDYLAQDTRVEHYV